MKIMDCSSSNMISYKHLQSKLKNVCWNRIEYLTTETIPTDQYVADYSYTDEDGEYIYTAGATEMFTFVEEELVARWTNK